MSVLEVIPLDIVDRIFGLVDEKFKEQKDFASALGVPAPRVSEWRKRKSASYQRCLVQIADVLGTTTDYLLTGTLQHRESDSNAAVPSFNKELSWLKGLDGNGIQDLFLSIIIEFNQAIEGLDISREKLSSSLNTPISELPQSNEAEKMLHFAHEKTNGDLLGAALKVADAAGYSPLKLYRSIEFRFRRFQHDRKSSQHELILLEGLASRLNAQCKGTVDSDEDEVFSIAEAYAEASPEIKAAVRRVLNIENSSVTKFSQAAKKP